MTQIEVESIKLTCDTIHECKSELVNLSNSWRAHLTSPNWPYVLKTLRLRWCKMLLGSFNKNVQEKEEKIYEKTNVQEKNERRGKTNKRKKSKTI